MWYSKATFRNEVFRNHRVDDMLLKRLVEFGLTDRRVVLRGENDRPHTQRLAFVVLHRDLRLAVRPQPRKDSVRRTPRKPP